MSPEVIVICQCESSNFTRIWSSSIDMAGSTKIIEFGGNILHEIIQVRLYGYSVARRMLDMMCRAVKPLGWNAIEEECMYLDSTSVST